MKQPVAYLNGAHVPVTEARLSVFDLGLVQGAAVTEMARTFRHEAFRLEQHLERLFRSLDAVGLSCGHTPRELRSVALNVVGQNAPLIAATHDLGIVIFVTPGPNPTYVGTAGATAPCTPTVCVHTFPLPFELWASRLERGQHLVVPGIRAVPLDTVDPRIKHRSRLHWWLADKEARTHDPLAAALLCDHRGRLTETATGNFFVVRGGTIETPRSGTTLAGVSQQVVAELAGEIDVAYREADLTIDDALLADEAFTSSTPYCICPVSRINGRPIGPAAPGPVFRKLATAWSAQVGVDIIKQMREGARDRAESTASRQFPEQ